MFSGFSRRQLLRLLGGLGAGGTGFLLSTLFHKDGTKAQTINVRENIYTFIQSPTKLAALRRGIQVMKSRPDTNPTSWIYQANIHGTEDSRNLTAWNLCQHGTFFFLSWHRMYLYYFERILRAASGDPTLTLPYWNYSDSAAQRSLPGPYRSPANSSNPLYVSQRNTRINQGNPLPAQDVTYTEAFRLTNFFSNPGSGVSFGGQMFSGTAMEGHRASPKGQLEVKPHDIVHVRIGGWMANVNFSARDPIFWSHHANIDRLWERWLRQGGGRANPLQDNTWMTRTFTFFDENGRQVTLSGSQVVNTAQQLNYRYDDSGVALSSGGNGPNQASQKASGTSQRLGVTSAKNVELGEARCTLTLPLIQGRGPQALTDQALQKRPVFLNVEGVQYNPGKPILYEIYINLPKGVTPTPESVYYVAPLALFAYPQGGTFSIDVTDVVRGLKGNNNVTGNSITITFVLPSEEVANLRSAGPSGRVRFKQVTLTSE